ncbi:MAG: aconitate hydratase AcnA [Anaerolineaceae bacterium]|jgi:aconitate hydratase
MSENSFNALDTLKTSSGTFTFYNLHSLQDDGYAQLARLPFSVRILLENALRGEDRHVVARQDVLNLAGWLPQQPNRPGMNFFPGRILLQDFTGVPVINDLAAMRTALARLGGDPMQVNPSIPVDLVIDHSVQVDFAGTPDAMARNAAIEFQRNRERYEFLHWAQKVFKNLRVVPPATGIVHQVNIEYLARLVLTQQGSDGQRLAFPDTLVGADSHTTMVNGLGVVAWGVGGIEAVSAMLDQPVAMLIPDVIGFKLTGRLPEGVTPTDLTLTIVQMLRKTGVVDKFVEFYGDGLDHLAVTDRVMIANMSPENGATVTYFPVDEQTLAYLRLTGRPAELIELVEAYYRAQGLFRQAGTPDPEFTSTLELDMSTVEPSLAGPKRPQDRVTLSKVQQNFRQALAKPRGENGYALPPEELGRGAAVQLNGEEARLGHGAVVIAAITSCTNTSNPAVMMAAGLLARKAVEKGLKVPPYVKTSLAPGSRVVASYLQRAGLLDPLGKLGFGLVGFGCTTCIGNSGPLPEAVVSAIQDNHLVAAAVLSGNRNFEGRINPNTLANYLASPPLVVAYALAGTVDIDLTSQPLGLGADGQPVYLRDVWPSTQEVQAAIQASIRPEMFQASYAEVFSGNPVWNAIQSGDSPLYAWDPASTYLREPPFFLDLDRQLPVLTDIHGARLLAWLGDSVTTDHISPAGEIDPHSAAGQYLIELGVRPGDFNSYGSRRGNDQVLGRGAFANPRLKNRLTPGVDGSRTVHLPDGMETSIYAASMQYKAEGVPLLIIAGKEYGTGSSRDWAAKGPLLLGVRVVIAESFERIHRSNLIGMGVLPLQFRPGDSAQSLGLTGQELFDVEGLAGLIGKDLPQQEDRLLSMRAEGGQESNGQTITFQVVCRLDTPLEVEYYRHGGILHRAIRELLK